MKPGYIPINSIRKNLFKIGQVCQRLNITPRTLRYYEKIGLLPGTKRTKGQTRLYTEQEITLIKTIKKLQAEKKSLAEIKNVLKKSGTLKNNAKKYKIFIDSTFSITPETAIQYDLEIIPMNIVFGYYRYKDFLTISPEIFVELENKKRLKAQTQAPTTAEYMQLFQQAIAEGYEQIISLHPDSRIVSSYDNAATAAKTLSSLAIKVIDTKLLSIGFNFVLEKIKDFQKLSITQIEKIIKKQTKNITEIIIINSLERFQNSEIQGLGAELMNFVPVLQHTAELGLVPIARCQNSQEALKFVQPQLKKFKKIIKASSTQKMDCLQYSSVLMANLGRLLTGWAAQL